MKILTTDFFSTIDSELMRLSTKLLFSKKDFLEEEKLCREELVKILNISKENMLFLLNARSALYHVLKSYSIGKWDEVCVAWWNCVSVANLVLQTWATPVYLDISRDNFSLSFESFKKRISSHTKVLILQETFGIPWDYQEIFDMCRKKGIKVIMDWAHSFGNSPYKEGIDAHIYSFGRDKILSTINWGLITFTEGVPEYFRTLQLFELPGKEVKKHFYYNIFGFIAYKTYGFLKIGKCIMALARKIKLFPEILSSREKDCDFNDFSFAYPQKLYPLLLCELKKYESIMKQRIKLGKMYTEGLKDSKLLWFPSWVEKGNFFRVPLIFLSDDKELNLRKNLVAFMREYNIYIWITWSGTCIAPLGSNTEKAGISKYPSPVAQDLSEKMVFLPNHRNITEKDVQKVIDLLLEFETHYV